MPVDIFPYCIGIVLLFGHALNLYVLLAGIIVLSLIVFIFLVVTELTLVLFLIFCYCKYQKQCTLNTL